VADDAVDSDLSGRSPGRPQTVTQTIGEPLIPDDIRRSRWHPAITHGGHPTQRRRCVPSDPDRDRPLDWQGTDADVIDPVPVAGEVHHSVRPQRAQVWDLLLDPTAPGREVGIECLKLWRHSPESNTQTEPPAGQNIDLGGLFGHQSCLTLWLCQPELAPEFSSDVAPPGWLERWRVLL
jgi:hypothetical protein